MLHHNEVVAKGISLILFLDLVICNFLFWWWYFGVPFREQFFSLS